MDIEAVQNLKDVELEYSFAVAMGFPILGYKRGPFALCPSSTDAITVFGGSEDTVSLSSFQTDLAFIPLEAGQELGAILISNDSGVTCRIGAVEASGANYLEALMRAIVLFKSTHPESVPAAP